MESTRERVPVPGESSSTTYSYTYCDPGTTTTTTTTVCGEYLRAFSFEEMKKNLDDASLRIMSDPRAQAMINSGKHTIEEVRKYIEDTLNAVEGKGGNSNKQSTTYTTTTTVNPLIISPTIYTTAAPAPPTAPKVYSSVPSSTTQPVYAHPVTTPRGTTTVTYTHTPVSTTTYTLHQGVWYPSYMPATTYRTTVSPITILPSSSSTSSVTYSSEADVNKIYELHPPYVPNKRIAFNPRLDAFFDHGEHCIIFYVDLPDFEKNDVSLEIDKHAITISGERIERDYNKLFTGGFSRIIKERVFGYFCRKFQLPKNAIEDSVYASMHEGVLTIKISCTPLQQFAQKKKIAVQ